MSEKLLPPKEAIKRLLAGMAQHDASDLHLKVGYAPSYRIVRHLRKLDMAEIPNTAYIEEMLSDIMPESRRAEYYEHGDLDFSARGEAGDRYRINVFRSTGEMNAAIRRVRSKIPTFDELNLPKIYSTTVANSLDGLILVAGVTSSGKSSTLAAMVEHINQTRSVHVVTIEDPIEFMFQPQKAVISQREIGIDVPNYAQALKYMVRQDPDCILIGEMRDRETMSAGLQAAETGHLVFGSLHVGDAQQTFTRILEFFPTGQHAFVRSSLANSLRAIMCQKLIPGIKEGTVYPATEVLLRCATLRDKIVHGQDDEIPAVIAQGASDGMRSFAESLRELIETEKVHYDTAMAHAPSRDALESAVKGIKTESHILAGRTRGGH